MFSIYKFKKSNKKMCKRIFKTYDLKLLIDI